MPAGVVKTKHDEKLWARAKASCRSQGHSPEKNKTRYWKCVGGSFQAMKKR